MSSGKKGRRLVFLGPPNSGKGTQAALLASHLGIPAISTGEMLRSAVEQGSDLGSKVESVMARGALVGDDLMADIVRERLARDDVKKGFILDGYPRTPAQAATLEQLLDSDLDAVVLIEAAEDVLIARALARGREDDKEEVVRERLRVYQEKTESLVAFYERQGLLHRIEGNQSIEEVQAEIGQSLGL